MCTWWSPGSVQAVCAHGGVLVPSRLYVHMVGSWFCAGCMCTWWGPGSVQAVCAHGGVLVLCRLYVHMVRSWFCAGCMCTWWGPGSRSVQTVTCTRWSPGSVQAVCAHGGSWFRAGCMCTWWVLVPYRLYVHMVGSSFRADVCTWWSPGSRSVQAVTCT